MGVPGLRPSTHPDVATQSCTYNTFGAAGCCTWCSDAAHSAAEGWMWSSWIQLIPGPLCSCFHGISAFAAYCKSLLRRSLLPCLGPAPWCTGCVLGCFSMEDCPGKEDVSCCGSWVRPQRWTWHKIGPCSVPRRTHSCFLGTELLPE